MAISAQQSAVYTETPTRTPVSAGNKYWADNLTWKDLPNPLEVCEPIITTGASGTFTTVDGKTVTVTNGIITGIV
jgi:hypothetical protein